MSGINSCQITHSANRLKAKSLSLFLYFYKISIMRNLMMTLLVLLTVMGYAQKGTIRGKVFDDKSGESLVGVTVLIKGTTKGAITDLDGKFSLNVEEGSYDLKLSYISYQPMIIEDIKVEAGEVNSLQSIRLKSSTEELDAVVVTADIVRSSESALTTIKRKSSAIMDGVSSQKMELIGDGTAAEAVKRVTGVSVEGGKYFYVRGLGDRYSKSMLNHVDIPGLDPDRNTLQMDIFPSGLISNMTVKKNFTADLPADFTGGLLNIETKDFPDKKQLTVSAGFSYNPGMHFNSDYLTYDGGNTDFLGFDDGTRALPERAKQNNIPTPISGASTAEVVDFIKSFEPVLGATRQNSFMDTDFGISLGNQIDLKAEDEQESPGKLGYIFSLSYKSAFKYYDDVFYGEYQRYIDPEKYEMRVATTRKGELGEHNVRVGLLGGLAYKNKKSKIRLTAMHLQNGISRAGRFLINNDRQAVGQSGYVAESDNLEYNQRSLTNILLNGKHVLANPDWEIEWRVSPTFSDADDPDIRNTAFTYTDLDTSFNAGAGGNPSRIWRDLDEVNVTSKMDVTRNYKFNGENAQFKFGFSHTYKQRDYEILFYDMQFFGGQSWSDPDPSNVLDDENIYPNKPNSLYYQSGNSDPNPNAYSSNVHNTAFYALNEFEILRSLKAIAGLRAENYVQRHTGRDQQYASGDTENGRNLDNEKVLESLDLFPSFNLIYEFSSMQKIRFAYARTIARPSFKELSFAQILDPISNRIFNGSLFTYSGWDGELTETRINNFDLRWEFYMKKGQLVSISAFYKQFDNPIELVRIPEQQTSTEYQPRNVGNGFLYGVEFEFRKDLDFISDFMSRFNVSGNLTLVESRVDMTDAEFNARKTFEKEGQDIKDYRQMAGQSPYVLNAGITYGNKELGLDAGAFYNVKGPTLKIVGGGLFPDVYQKPYHGLNVSVNKTLGKEGNTKLDFNISNVLNSQNKSVYKSFKASDQIYTLMNPGRTFSIGISHSF